MRLSLPSPIHDNYWRNRLLTEEEYAQTIEAAKAIMAEEQEKAKAHAATVKAFLAAMKDMGYHHTSTEFKYVSDRIRYRTKFGGLDWNIAEAQRDLRAKAEEAKRQQAEAERQQERLVKLAEEARGLGIDPIAYFNDEKGLRQAVRAAKETKLEEALESAPYYVKASFYGHCLRGDWSGGRDSYGCDELRCLEIPAEDEEHPELHAIALELKRDAADWEGDDGRYFRESYQRLDALLSEEESRLLDFLNETYVQLHYSW